MITVIVKPAASRNCVTRVKEDTYRVSTTAIAEHGQANQKVISLLADYLDIPKSSLSIKRGEGSKIKLIEIS